MASAPPPELPQEASERSRTEVSERSYFYQLFNIGNGAPVQLMKFIESLEKELGKKAEKEMLGMQPGDVPRTWADTSKLKKLGYESKTGIAEGVRKYVAWFKAYHTEKK